LFTTIQGVAGGRISSCLGRHSHLPAGVHEVTVLENSDSVFRSPIPETSWRRESYRAATSWISAQSLCTPTHEIMGNMSKKEQGKQSTSP